MNIRRRPKRSFASSDADTAGINGEAISYGNNLLTVISAYYERKACSERLPVNFTGKRFQFAWRANATDVLNPRSPLLSRPI